MYKDAGFYGRGSQEQIFNNNESSDYVQFNIHLKDIFSQDGYMQIHLDSSTQKK